MKKSLAFKGTQTVKHTPMNLEIFSLFLPPSTLEYFDCDDYKIIPSDEPFGETYILRLTEKNIFPVLPEEYANKPLRFKGYTEKKINDFPIRGRKVVLHLRQRKWTIDGVPGTVMRELTVEHDGVKLTKDFAFFFEKED